MVCYVGILPAPAEGFNLCPRLIMMVLPTLGIFWCSVVTVVTFSGNLSNFEKNLKKDKKKSFKIQKKKKSTILKIPKNPRKKIQQKNQKIQ